MKFFKSDQAAVYDGYRYIGIEGKEIQELTSGALGGTIIRYASTADNWEFYFDMSGVPELNENDAEFFTVFEGDYLSLFRRKDDRSSKEFIGEIPWKDTKKRALIEQSSPKKLTPRNIISAAIKYLYLQKTK